MKTERILTYLHSRPGIIKCAVLSKVLGVADNEYAVRFKKFKMPDPIWRTIFSKFDRIRLKLVTRGFSGSVITNMQLHFRNSKCRIQYGGRFFEIQTDLLKYWQLV